MFSHIKELFSRPSGYTIARSVRLRSSASAYFNRTPASAGNRKTWTWSGWVKRGVLSGSSTYALFDVQIDSNNWTTFWFRNDAVGYDVSYTSTANRIILQSTAVYRDPSAWYHLVFSVDTTQATAANRIRIYINGIEVTLNVYAVGSGYVPQNTDLSINTTNSHAIGRRNTATPDSYFDGYLTEINFIDGQALTPSSFGSTNATTGVWQPAKYTGTYGTNGFYLNFSDNSSNTATTIGKDYSGNGNNWTPNNISVTSGSTYDSMTDVPTLTSATAANYCVMNPLDKDSSATVSDGNLTVSRASGAYSAVRASFMLPTSGKFYAEATVGTTTASGTSLSFGFATDTAVLNNAAATGQYILYGAGSGSCAIYSSGTSLGSVSGVFSTGDILQIAFDGATGKAWVGKNNVWYNATAGTTGDPANGTNNTFSLSGLNIFPVAVLLNDTLYFNAGQRPFSYTPPTGYVALNTYNLPTSTITNGAAYMAATLYAGSSSAQSITNTVNGVSFQPDLVWGKNRSNVNSHRLTDVNRGVGLVLFSNSTNGDTTGDGQLSSFNSNGWTFTSGAGAGLNESGNNYVAWNWKAGGTPVTNTNGSITSTVSAGATQGFSVVTYTGTGAVGTVGHGLGVAPSMIIFKERSGGASSGVNDWGVYHVSTGNTGQLRLDLTAAFVANSTCFNNTSPTSSVFTIGSQQNFNESSGAYVAYCFAAVAGYSAFGSYTGNGSTDGPFVYCGFRPRWVMIKCTNTTGDWWLEDTSRNTYNAADLVLFPNTSGAESGSSVYYWDFLSNGFKLRSTSAGYNGSGNTYIYAAFAENPFKNALAR